VWTPITAAPAVATSFPFRVSLRVSFGGGAKSTSGTLTYSDDATVLRAVPSFIPVDAAIGVPLTIYGTNFVESTGISIRYNVVSGAVFSLGVYKREINAIVTTVPAGVPGETLTLNVALNGVDFTTTTATIRVYSMSSIAPKSVLATGGSRLDIIGTNFLATGNSSNCIFLDPATESLKEVVHAFYVSATLMQCYTPPLPAEESRYAELSLLAGSATTERNNIISYTSDVRNVSQTIVPGRPAFTQAGDTIITIEGRGFQNLGTLSRCNSGPPATSSSGCV
jgi:hypothetical protein